MLVPEFYLRGWGERRAGSGGMFGDPQGPLWCKLGGAGDTEAGVGAKRGVLVALRDLGSKLGSPSTLGSLASNCKANLFGAGRGGGSPVGGEVTGIRCRRPRLLKPGNWPAPPPRHSQHPAQEYGGARLHTRPNPPRGRGPGGPEPAEGSQFNLSAGRGGRRQAAGGQEPGEDFSSRQLGGGGEQRLTPRGRPGGLLWRRERRGSS